MNDYSDRKVEEKLAANVLWKEEKVTPLLKEILQGMLVLQESTKK